MTDPESRWERVADGLGLILIGLNVFWLAATVTLLLSVLGVRGGPLFLTVWWVAPPLLYLTGLIYCRKAPVPPPIRLTLRLALAVFVLAALIGLGGGVLEWMLVNRGAPQGKAESFFQVWIGSLALSVLFSGSGHLLLLHSLQGIARRIDKERLADRARIVFRVLLGLVIFTAAVYFGANEDGQKVGGWIIIVGIISWLCLYSFLLIRLHDALLYSAPLIPERGQRGR